jgi:sterol desaturase/sphingolipid hydroxylase (fatty acid hydroxylase superfamily)
MANVTIKNKGSKQLFKNPVLERLSRTHIAIPLILYSLISVGLIYYAVTQFNMEFLPIVGWYFAGFLFFTFLEYIAHRYLFHLEPTSKVREKIQYTVHGVHHEFPKDKDRLAMPPILALVYVAVLFFIFKFILGNTVYAFLPGMLTGYALYLFVHYAVHAFQPPKNFLKVLWIHHGIHHYKSPDRAYGVSSPFWDYIFRTMPK